MKKPDYGFDAPDVMRNLLIFGATTAVAGAVSLGFWSKIVGWLLVVAGGTVFLLGVSMVVYGLVGKFRVRAWMLSRIVWRGDEQVLDIGTGSGLLMIGAAKRLTSGKSVGIDIWRAEDLTENTIEKTLENARIEGVLAKIEIKSEDAQRLSFPDESFDVVLSQFCIHNIEDKKGQEKACLEIARVLKKGGTALIGDYLPTHDYARFFEKAGLKIVASRAHFGTAFSLTWIVEAKK